MTPTSPQTSLDKHATASGRLLLLDTPSLYFRAFYGVPESVTAPDGMPVNAIRGLLDFISFLVERYRPERLVACMDADWRPAFRVALLPSYKAHRVAPAGGETVPDALTPQVPVIEQLLDAIGLCRLGVAGFEADDVIATLAVSSTSAVDIVTGDRDLFQLVDDAKPVRIVYIARGVGKAELVDEAAVTKRYGIPGRSYADFAVLRGDPSDGLPGVPGIGDKTAAALVSRFGSLTAILAALETESDAGFPAGTRTKLRASVDYLSAAPTVVATRTDVATGVLDDALPTQIRDPENLLDLIQRYGLTSPVQRLLNVLRIAPSAQPTEE
ncbi:MAG TPA: 5'-3' exonuclease [Acidothermaceae bacterium]|jgi:5'-3' exonuclease|nr:5'-3' exonuclease [Acidothermaceae bacterium]